MGKNTITDEIIKRVEKEEENEKRNKRIEKKRQQHENRISQIDNGYNPSTGKHITSTTDKTYYLREEYMKYNADYVSDASKEINREFGIDDDLEVIVEKEEPLRPKRTYNSRRFHKNLIIGSLICLSLVSGTTFATSKITTYKCHQDEINRKMEPYNASINNLVKSNTFLANSNALSKNGKELKKLDNNGIPRNTYGWVECEKLANYIQNCDNPDLAALVLYRLYGKSKNPVHNHIVRNTFKYLKFDGYLSGSEENLDLYLSLNGYDNLDDYNKACEKELIRDGDSKLDNLALTLRKND